MDFTYQHGQSQRILRQRNLLGMAVLALAGVIGVMLLVSATRPREIVLQPVLRSPLLLSSAGVSREYLELVSLRNEAASIRSHSFGTRDVRSNSSEITSGSESSHGAQAGTSLEASDRTSGSTYDGLEDRSAVTNSLRENSSHQRGAQGTDSTDFGVRAGLGGASDRAAAGAGGKPSIGRSLAGSLPGVSASRTYNTQQSDRLELQNQRSRGVEDSNSTSQGSRNEHAVSDSASSSSGTYERDGVFSRASTTTSSSRSREQAESLAQSYERRASQMEEKAAQLSNDASWAETHGMQISENLSQELQDWYRREAASLPSGVEAPGLHETSLRADQRQIRDGLISKFFEQRRAAVYDLVGDRLEEPDLVQLRQPEVANEKDVVGQHRAATTLALPTSHPDMTAAEAAKTRIKAGREQLATDQAGSTAARAGHVIGGSDVRQHVEEDLNRGFFNDPKLRR